MTSPTNIKNTRRAALLAAVAFTIGALIAAASPRAEAQQKDPQARELILNDINNGMSAQARPGGQARAGRPNGSEAPPNIMIDRVCVACHGKVAAAPTIAQLRTLPPEKIFATLTTGTMKDVSVYNDAQKRQIAIYLSGKEFSDGKIDRLGNLCPSERSAKAINVSFGGKSTAASWTGWSPDHTNGRYQKSPGLDRLDVQHLKVKWAFAAPGATNMYGQPTVEGGRVYITDDTNALYALDAETGCTYWVFMAEGYMRGAPAVGKANGRKAIFLGDVNGRGYGVDAATGKLIWKRALDDHPLARISASPTYYNGHVYYPLTGLEEIVSGRADFLCCTTRGAVIAVDANTGKQTWKSYAIQQTPVKQPKLVYGREYWGPAGASVWAAPTIDVKRNQLYFVTGNMFSEPETGDADAMHAVDLQSGKRIWRRQAYKNDFFAGGTIATGPDFDFSASSLIVSPGGRDLVVSGEKSGDVWALDPKTGDVVWHTTINKNHVNGVATARGTEILFGGATDGATIYWGMRSGGIIALDAATGAQKWLTKIPGLPKRANGIASRSGVTAAVSLIPSAVFVGGLDGSIRAFSTQDGSEIWSYDTGTPVQTVNGVAAKGGSIGNAGPVIAERKMFVTSGYIGFQNGDSGNLLLAFAPE